RSVENAGYVGDLWFSDAYAYFASDATSDAAQRLEQVELTMSLTPHSPVQNIVPFALQGILPHSRTTVSFPVRKYRKVTIDQQQLARLFHNCHAGPFDQCFGDLSDAAHNLEDLDMDEVRKRISAEAIKGSEVFEAFGMKIPAGQITLWGSLVLLSVQLYL